MSVHFVDLWILLCGIRPLYGLEFWSFMGSVHFVDWSLHPSWDPSTLWTCLSFRPLLGSSTLWTCLSFFTLVESVHVVDWSFDPVWDPSTLWTYFYPCWVCPHCGLVSWPFVGSVHFLDLFEFSTLVGFVHVVDWSLDPSWGPSTDCSNLIVVIITT